MRRSVGARVRAGVLAGLIGLGGASKGGTVEPYKIHSDGYGPVRVGMTVARAEQALGVKLDVEDYGSCAQATPVGGHAAITLMVMEGRVTRASAHSREGGVVTPSGIGVGDTVAAVRAAYRGRLEKSPHNYDPTGKDHYLDVWVSNGHGVRFEIADGRVQSIHGGDRTIALVEGCA